MKKIKMTTLTITINERTKEGRSLIERLQESSSVLGVKQTNKRMGERVSTRKKTKLDEREDSALGLLMKKSETGKLVSRASIMKALKSVK